MEQEIIENDEIYVEERKWKELLIISVNSVVTYLLAFLIVYLFYNIIIINRAATFGLHAKMLYWKINWLDGVGYKAWNSHSIAHIFGVGPLSCLILSVIVLIVFFIHRENKGPFFSMFCIWMIIHSLNMFFGSVIIGIMTTIHASYEYQILKTISDRFFFTMHSTYSSQGLGYAFDWFFVTTRVKWILFIICVLFSMVIGYYSAIYFLISSNSDLLLKNKKNRKLLIIFQTIIPWFIGSLFLLILKSPHNIRYEVYFYITILLLIIPAVINVNRNPPSLRYIFIPEEPEPLQIYKMYFIGMFIFYIVFRILFNNGIPVAI